MFVSQLKWKCGKEDETRGGYSKDVLLQILQKVLSDPSLLLIFPCSRWHKKEQQVLGAACKPE